MNKWKSRRKSWIRYAWSSGKLDVVAGDEKRYQRARAAEERAWKRRQAAIKAAKTRREKAEAARVANMLEARATAEA